MGTTRVALGALLFCLATFPAAAERCQLNFISHGTFRDSGGCLLFEDDLGSFYEVIHPKPAWQDGVAGTVYAEFTTENFCSAETPIQICTFDEDYSRFVVGTLIFRNFVECPGYTIDTGSTEYLILNCEDFGSDLCKSANLDLRIEAEVLVDTGVSICLGTNRSVVLSYEFR